MAYQPSAYWVMSTWNHTKQRAMATAFGIGEGSLRSQARPDASSKHQQLVSSHEQPGAAITCKPQLPLCSLGQEGRSQNKKPTKKSETYLNIVNK